MMIETFQQRESMERARASVIDELGIYHGVRPLAAAAIERGDSVQMFRQTLLEQIAPRGLPATAVGMTKKEVGEYSLVGHIGRVGSDPHPRKLGLEHECSLAVAKNTGREVRPGS